MTEKTRAKFMRIKKMMKMRKMKELLKVRLVDSGGAGERKELRGLRSGAVKMLYKQQKRI